MKKNIILLLSVLMVAVAFGQKTVYLNSDYAENPFQNIKQIAILPFTTPISSQRNVTTEKIRRHHRTTYDSQNQNIGIDELKQLQNSRGTEFQNDLYSALLEKSYLQNKLQNTKITNALLSKNKISIDSLQNYLPGELAKLLSVDAILYGSITQRVSGYGRHSSNIIHCVISLNNNENTQIWQYSISEAKSLKKSEDNLITSILKKAMKEFPAEANETKKTGISKLNIFKKK